MSLRQRLPFKFSADSDSDENGSVLDEQEQEELIEDLRTVSSTRNEVYSILLRILIALSCILHFVYLFSSSPRQSPLSVLIPPTPPINQLTFTPLFIIVHIAVHFALAVNILQPSHRSWLSIPDVVEPVPWIGIFLTTEVAPLLSIADGCSLADFLWWTETIVLSGLIHSAQQWMEEEAEAIRKLESMRYEAKGV